MAVILCLLSSNVDALTSTSISEDEKVAVALVIDDVFYLHAIIIRVFPDCRGKELRYNICTLPGGTEPIGLGNYGGS